MKKLLIQELITLAAINLEFSEEIPKWKNVKLYGKPLSNIEFSKHNLKSYTDVMLLELYTLIIRQSSQNF